MATVEIARLSPEEYLARERRAETKNEYRDGKVFPMTGASRAHNLIVTSLVAELYQRLKGEPCEVYPNDMRVKIGDSPHGEGLQYVYPDSIVVRGEPQFEDDQYIDTLCNPTLIVEVLSPSTEAYDRGEKFIGYRTIPSLREYLLVSQGRPRIERFVRQADDTWRYDAAAGLDATLELDTLPCVLLLAEIYHRVQFDRGGEASAKNTEH